MYFCERLTGVVFMSLQRFNVNDIGKFPYRNFNDNVNDRGEKPRRKGYGSERINQVDRLADHLCQKMGNSDMNDPNNRTARTLYCKAFYLLNEDKVWSLAEIALKKTKPTHYLSTALSHEIRFNAHSRY